MWLCCCHKNLLGSTLLSLYGFNNKICLWYFQRLPRFDCFHSNMHLKWKTNSLDINTHGGEYNLAVDSSNYTFWATYVNAIGENVQVTQKVFTNLVEDVKSSCSNFFLPFSLCLCFLWFFGLLFVFDFVATT